MSSESLFIAIEGLDGSGKTTIARQLAYFMQYALNTNVKLTFEPHDPSCGGLFIRQVLEKKIRNFSHETLMLAFASNRLDHCDREINKWLSEDTDRIIICDRYYLSSLVYQSNEEYSFADVMQVNNKALKPDLTIFMNVSNETCLQRMKDRNKPKELFERNLSETRAKYFDAIEFLKASRDEQIVVVDANGSMKEVLENIVNTISKMVLDHRRAQLSSITNYEIQEPNVFSINGAIPNIFDKVVTKISNQINSESGLEITLDQKVHTQFEGLDFNEKGALFFNYLNDLGYKIGEKYPWTHLDAYELEFQLPGGLRQRGTALIVNENQRYDVILESVSSLQKMTDFMFVFSPGPSELVTKYYEREIIQFKNKEESLFPCTQLITEQKLLDGLASKITSNNI